MQLRADSPASAHASQVVDLCADSPASSLCSQVVDALRPVTDKPLDCHLMIVEPELRVADFAKVRAGQAAAT